MRRYAQILNSKVHWIFEANDIPEYASDILIVDITTKPEVQEGWDYNSTTGEFTNPVIEPMNEEKTIQQQMAELREQNLVLMDAIATIYEKLSGGAT
jgi:hypothetical protein